MERGRDGLLKQKTDKNGFVYRCLFLEKEQKGHG